MENATPMDPEPFDAGVASDISTQGNSCVEVAYIGIQ